MDGDDHTYALKEEALKELNQIWRRYTEREDYGGRSPFGTPDYPRAMDLGLGAEVAIAFRVAM